MSQRMMATVASLLVALAATAWGQATPGGTSAERAALQAANFQPAGKAAAAAAADQPTGKAAAEAPAGNFQPAPEGLGLAAFAVAGVQIAWFDATDWDEEAAAAGPHPVMGNGFNGLQGGGAFGQGPSYTLVLAGKFAAPVSKINGVTVEKVVADSGEDLLSPNLMNFRPLLRQNYQNGIKQPSKVFSGNLRLTVPGEKATTIKELSGKVYYTILGQSRIVNLGLTEFKEGATGTQFKAKIEGIEDIQFGTLTKPVLKLTLSGVPDEIGEFKFYDADGKVFNVNNWGAPNVEEDNSKTFRFLRLEGNGYPAKGRIEVEVFDDVKKLVAPFKLENVPLFGRPAKPGA
jgi:hypothetical protein